MPLYEPNARDGSTALVMGSRGQKLRDDEVAEDEGHDRDRGEEPHELPGPATAHDVTIPEPRSRRIRIP